MIQTDTDHEICPKCEGSGEILNRDGLGDGCRYCGGTGVIRRRPAHVDASPTFAPGMIRVLEGSVCRLPDADKCTRAIACPDCEDCKPEYRRRKG